MRASKIKSTKTILFALFTISLFLGYLLIFAEEIKENNDMPDREGFLAIPTTYFTIYYEPGVMLQKVYRRLSKRRFYISGSFGPNPLSSFEEKTAYRMNILFERVKEIMGMYPSSVNFKIKIFKQQKTLNDEYFIIARRQERIKAFYSPKYNTIYTSEESVSDSVMAHEMAHLLEHYFFSVPPSDKLTEMLAIYVDSHLEE